MEWVVTYLQSIRRWKVLVINEQVKVLYTKVQTHEKRFSWLSLFLSPFFLWWIFCYTLESFGFATMFEAKYNWLFPFLCTCGTYLAINNWECWFISPIIIIIIHNISTDFAQSITENVYICISTMQNRTVYIKNHPPPLPLSTHSSHTIHRSISRLCVKTDFRVQEQSVFERDEFSYLFWKSMCLPSSMQNENKNRKANAYWLTFKTRESTTFIFFLGHSPDLENGPRSLNLVYI